MAYDPSQGLINGAAAVGGLIEQGRKTQEYVNGLFDTAARRRAGSALAAGRYGEAAGLLGERGDLENADLLQRRQTRATGLGAMVKRDYKTAQQTAASGADAELYAAAQGAEDDDRKARANWLGNAANALLQIKDPAQRKAAFTGQIVPVLKAMGMDDATIDTIDDQALTDEGLNAFRASLGQATKGEVRQDPNTGDLITIDPATGKASIVYRAGKKADWKEFTRSDGSTYWKDMNSLDGEERDQPPADAATPQASGAVYDQVASVASAAGARPEEVGYLRRLAQVESSGNPSARNGSSTGLFQFQPDTFRAVGGGDLNSVEDQTRAALTLARRDRQALEQRGVPVTDANLYIMHQQGAGGGMALLTAPPEVNAVAALTPVYGDAEIARKAIVGNGGRADMTAGEFVAYWRNRWGGGGSTPARSGGARVVEGDEPQPKGRVATEDDKRRMGLPAEGSFWIDEKGKPSPLGGNQGQAQPRKAEADLRKEFNARPEVKEFRDIDNSYRTIKRLFSGEGSAAGDIAGIFSFMKMLDPGSVVREGEFANAQNAAGVPDRIRNLYNKTLNGQRLNPKQRQDFINQAESIFTTRSARFNQIADEYRGYARDYDLNPDRVVTISGGGQGGSGDTAGAPKGAQRGQNGRYYYADPNKKGSFPEVRKAPDGNWYFKSADGNFYKVD